MNQAIKTGYDFLDSLKAIYAKKDYSKFVCSKLVSASFEAGGSPRNVNTDEVTPADPCSFKLYPQDDYPLTGESKSIKGFNSIAPDRFGSL